MTLLRSQSEEPDSPQARDIRRNCGQLLGRLDSLLPCFHIAQCGVPGRALRRQTTDREVGLFAVGARMEGKRPGVEPRMGLLLPISLCRDEAMRAALLQIPALLETRQSLMSERRCRVQARLDEAFGGDLKIAYRESLDGFFALEPSPAFFHRLHESFDYVTEVLDNPASCVRITGTSRFGWRSYGELMEWYHGLRGSERFGAWPMLTPFFVCGNTAALHSYSTERWARTGLIRPAETFSKWFVLRPGLADARLGIRLNILGESGFSGLRLTLDDTKATVFLSERFNPFPELLAWGREIDEGDLPVEVEIDEEGDEVVLTVLPTDNPQRVLLRVTRTSEETTVLLEGIVARAALASSLKAEVLRFFAEDFNPQHWDAPSDFGNFSISAPWLGGMRENPEHLKERRIHIRDSVLNHPWLSSAQ